MGIGIWAHLAACASRDETSPAMDYGLWMFTRATLIMWHYFVFVCVVSLDCCG